MPTKAQLTDSTAEQMVTARKFLHRRMAERAGKNHQCRNQQRADKVHGQHNDDGNDNGDQQIVSVRIGSDRLCKDFVKSDSEYLIVEQHKHQNYNDGQPDAEPDL